VKRQNNVQNRWETERKTSEATNVKRERESKGNWCKKGEKITGRQI
jgi:hypothetical protein